MMWLTRAILVIAIILFVTEWVRVDVVALGVLSALMLTGVLEPAEALAGFSSGIVLSIASLFIVGGAVFHTGLAALLADRILRLAGGSETRLLVVLMTAIGVMSAFISSTGVVALMLPAVVSLAGSMKISTSRLLIPLAFSALLGGATTLIGTPPNMVVSDTLRGAGYAPFDFFAFTPVGGLLLAAGVAYLLTAGRRLLPDRKAPQEIQQATTPGELFEIYRLPDNLFRLRVMDQSPLAGQRLDEARLGHDYGLTVIAIERHLLPGNGRSRDQKMMLHRPEPDTLLQTSDELLVQGDNEKMGQAAGFWQLAIMAADPIVQEDVITNEVGIAEVIIRPRSALVGKTLADVRFGSTYHLTVLSIRRPGVDEALSVKDTPLKFGDMLLVQGEWRNIFALKRLRQDFVVMGEREAAQLGAFGHWEKAPVALVILVGMVLVIALNILELTQASMLAALLMVLAGCLTIDDGYDAIDWKSLVLIAGMLPMSTALVKVGLVDVIAAGFVQTLGQLGPVWLMAGLFLLTATLTQVLSNTTTVVLVAPIALATAVSSGVQPHAFLMTIAIAASMAFATPVASPVNTLVMSAGHYKFSDYARVGLPLLALCFVIVLVVVPLLWPF